MFIILVTTLAACEEIQSYPETPEINFNEFRYDDTTLVFSFVDGDGDFGLTQADTAGLFNRDSAYYYNFFLNFYEKKDSMYEKKEFKIPTNYRVTDLPEPAGQNKTLKGKVEVDLTSYSSFPDTFKLQFYIVDKAFNHSDTVMTPPLSFHWDDEVESGL